MNKTKIFTPRFSLKEQIFIVQRLSFLIEAGVPILESLKMVRGFRSKAKREVFDQIIKSVNGGQTLSKSFEKFSYTFSPFFINVIKVGETAGVLGDNLGFLAQELKKERELKNKIISSLIYPFLILFATLGIILLLLLFIFPKVLPIFKSLNMKLPLPTKILILASDFLKAYGLYLLILVFVLIFLFLILIKKSSSFKKAVDFIVLKLPIFGKVFQNYQLANFCRTFSILIKAGVPLVEATKILFQSTTNLVYKKEIEKLKESVAKGQRIQVQLEKNPKLFPEIMTQMIATGEKSGKLSRSLFYLAELYEGDFDEMTKNLSSLLEPFLMIFLGFLVAFIAISIIIPIYNVTQYLSPK